MTLKELNTSPQKLILRKATRTKRAKSDEPSQSPYTIGISVIL